MCYKMDVVNWPNALEENNVSMTKEQMAHRLKVSIYEPRGYQTNRPV